MAPPDTPFDAPGGPAPPEAAETDRVAGARVTNALRDEILSGALEPGSRLRQEDLARRFRVSRIPIREALRRLETEGLVHLVPNSGAWIARLDLADCIEIYRIRERLEPMALAESCACLTAPDLAALSGLATRIEASASVEDFLLLDREFHLLSYRRAGMPRLLDMITGYWNSTQQYRRAFMQTGGIGDAQPVFDEHRLIVDALSRRDGTHAGLLLEGHIRRTRRQLETRLAGDTASAPQPARTRRSR